MLTAGSVVVAIPCSFTKLQQGLMNGCSAITTEKAANGNRDF